MHRKPHVVQELLNTTRGELCLLPLGGCFRQPGPFRGLLLSILSWPRAPLTVKTVPLCARMARAQPEEELDACSFNLIPKNV